MNSITLRGEGGEGFNDSYVTTNQIQAIFHPSLRTQPTFPEATTGLGNERGISILMTCHYPGLGGESDWLKHISHEAQPIESTTQIWVVKRHQYGISSVFPRKSFRGKPVVASGNSAAFYAIFPPGMVTNMH